MNRTSQLLSITAIALIVLIAACRKTPDAQISDPFTPVEPTLPSTAPTGTPALGALFSDLKPTPQIITVPAGVAHTVYAAKGTELNFYPNSFKDASGNTITTGNVQVEITEMYKAGDMISNQASTTADGDLLESGGQVYIKATAAGQPVYPNKYRIGFPKSTPDTAKKMAIYKGITSNPNGITTWKIDDTTKVGKKTNGTEWTGSGPNGKNRFLFDSCTDFGWINCDRVSDVGGPKTCVDVIISDTSCNKKNTEVFIVFPSINSVAYPEAYLPTKNTFRAGNSGHYAIPTGVLINIVVITKKGSQYYYFEQKGTNVVDSLKVTADMRILSTDSVKIKLSSL